MKKTAMQELIDGLDLTKIANRDKLVMVKYIIAKCLELEKEQILAAYNNGSQDMALKDEYNPAEYYNQTYNQKQHIIDIMKADEDDGLYNQNK